MKYSLLFKFGFVLPAIIFADYLIMVLFGCTSCLFGLDEKFYCGSYCLVGKILLILSVGVFIWIITPEIRSFLNPSKNAPAEKEQKSN